MSRKSDKLKACQLTASVRDETAYGLQSLPDETELCIRTEKRGNIFKNIRIQMKTHPQKSDETLQPFKNLPQIERLLIERLANLAFVDCAANVQEIFSLQYFEME